jgi:hypothetical protein
MGMIDPRGQGGSGSGGEGLWCALCGAGYVAGRAECADCGVPLVENPPLSPDDIGDDDGEQTAYEFADLNEEERFVVDRVLADAGVVHAWDGTSLVVAPYDADEVDRLLDGAADLDEHEGVDVDDVLLDDEAEQVVYDLEDWDADKRTELDGQLEAEGIAHAFDETGDLVVLAADEDRVDAIIDAIDFPDQLDADHDAPDEGLAAVEAMGALFVAVDRLKNDPADTTGTVDAVDAARRVAEHRTPFGFDPGAWDDIVGQAGALRRLLETEEEVVDDEAVEAAAKQLHTTLRPFV